MARGKREEGQRPTRAVWEHLIVMVQPGLLQTTLSQLGRDGWEVVEMCDVVERNEDAMYTVVRVLLKRPMEGV